MMLRRHRLPLLFSMWVILGLSVPPLARAQFPSGLVSYWNAEGNANDSAGSNDGTLQGGVTFTTGKVGQAFSLNGTTADVKVPSASNLNVGAGPGLTIALWIDPSTVVKQPLVEWNNGVGPREGSHFWISAGNPGDLYANLIDTGLGDHIIGSGAGVIGTGTFQHVALTYDKASGTATLYHDGAIVAGPTNLGTFTPQTSFDLYFGARVAGDLPGTLPLRYGGSMDDIELFNRALTSAEIQGIVHLQGCRLDMDGIGIPPADIATDIVYIVRQLLGLNPVPTRFRVLDPRLPSDATIAANVAGIGMGFDVDTNGHVDAATDIVYIARHLLALPPVPASFRVLDPSIPSDTTIAGNIDALCP